MRGNLQSFHAPPRILEGGALLFWGGVTGHPVIGLLCALLVEARSWTDLRWEFGQRGFVRAWYLAIGLGLVVSAWVWLEGASPIFLFEALVWIPVCLLPVILAQNYAREPTMPLNTFSVVARRKMLIDRKAGRDVRPIQVHIGYPYLCAVMVAAAMTRIDEIAFFAGAGVLITLALFFASSVSRLRPIRTVIALLLVTIFGAVSSVGLKALWLRLDSPYSRTGGGFTSGDLSQTAIGKLGRLKQSKGIRWRVEEAATEGPRLFREAVYNHYSDAQWWHRPIPERGEEGRGRRLETKGRSEQESSEVDKREEDYDPLWDRVTEDGLLEFVFDEKEFARNPEMRRRLTVKGKVDTKTPLPLPDDAQRLSGFQVTDGGVDVNSLGTVRLENPDHGIASFEVFVGGRPLHEAPPDPDRDLQVPLAERAPGRLDTNERWVENPARKGIRDICEAWGLRGLSAAEAVQVIREKFFSNEFTYSMFLRSAHPSQRSSAVARFLSETRVGHCEYYATAAVLLLREAGIPARYCVGYSGQEKNDNGEWLLRGSHAHAWCRVWHGTIPPDEIPKGRDLSSYGLWKDFDATTPRWPELEGSGKKWSQHLVDWWHNIREDALIWRTSPGNAGKISGFFVVAAILLVAYLALRLWKGRRHQEGASSYRWKAETRRTPLHELIHPAEKLLGPRGEGRTFSEWILGLLSFFPGLESDLRRALCFYWRARFDPAGLSPGEADKFAELCEEMRRRLSPEGGLAADGEDMYSRE